MKIIATHSFRGGSGKSFVALNMAVASARAGIKTLVMDCDFGSPSFQANLNCKSSPVDYGNNFLLATCTDEEMIYSTDYPNLDVIYADPRPVIGEGLLKTTEETHWKALQQLSHLRETLAKKGYQRLFLDTSPELTYNSISALMVADSIILVHRPVTHSLEITIYILQTVYAALKKSLKQRSFFLLYNQVPHGTPEEVRNLLDELTAEFKKHIEISVLGNISLDPTLDFNKTLILQEQSRILDDLEQMLAELV